MKICHGAFSQLSHHLTKICCVIVQFGLRFADVPAISYEVHCLLGTPVPLKRHISDVGHLSGSVKAVK
jgi:hypothetical protein